ncbi:anthrone oxygenase family protein [Streptomyces murinus]|uniref:anthrone oxygenase family protein n=1 Tax=Streptomyces murinus TaxID=33900 RepID=UPI000A3A5ADD|nr:anthrone oxygenase family protein [Streptomyces murinus]
MTNAILVKITRYVCLLGGGVLTGGALTTFVLELALRRLGAVAYIQVRQAEHDYFPWFIGVVFVPTFIAVVVLVFLARKAGSPALWPAAAALVLALVPTFVVNAPINLDQFDWNAQAPPADWAGVRDRWQIAHAVRTAFCVIALGCLGVAIIDRPFERTAVT